MSHYQLQKFLYQLNRDERAQARYREDVDSLIASVRNTYSGQGGPELPAAVSTRSFNDPSLSSRLDSVMVSLDRMNLMRIAAGRVPYSMPVTANFRFTSGFGAMLRTWAYEPGGRSQ